MNRDKTKCLNCKPCNILSGYGGAGTFSDGKLNFIPRLGKSDLTKYMPESVANKLIDETEEIFNKLQNHLRSDEAREKLESLGFRTWYGGTNENNQIESKYMFQHIPRMKKNNGIILPKKIIKEMITFFVARLSTLGLEMLIMFIMFLFLFLLLSYQWQKKQQLK